MIFWKANFVSTSALSLLSLKFHSHPCPFEKIEETSRNMFHKTWHFCLFQESKLVLVPFYSPRWHCHLLWDFSKETSSAPLMTDEYISARCASDRGVLRGVLQWTPWLVVNASLRCCVKTNLGPTLQKLQVCSVFLWFFFLTNADDISWCVEKNGEEKHRKKTNSLISWWAILDGLKRKKNFLSSLCRPFECILKISR